MIKGPMHPTTFQTTNPYDLTGHDEQLSNAIVEKIMGMNAESKNSSKSINDIRMSILRKIGSIPFDVLKLSKYYYSVSFHSEGGTAFHYVQNIDNRANGKIVSGSSYIKHLFLNRKYKKIYDNNICLGHYGIHEFKDNLPVLDKFDPTIIMDSGNKVKFFVDTYTICIVSSRPIKRMINVSLNNMAQGNSIRIEFIGLNAGRYYSRLYKIVTHYKPTEHVKSDNTFYIAMSKTIEDHVGQVLLKHDYLSLTSFDNIICENDIIDEIKDKLVRFVKAEFIYSKYKINNTFGILLRGVPGTGKTSIIKSIVHYMRISNTTIKSGGYLIFSLDVSVSSRSLSESIKLINDAIESDKRSFRNDDDTKLDMAIIIIEEIDSVMNASRGNDSGEINSKVKLLLEFLDGINTPSEYSTIFLASTNYHEKLDPALLRAGRFDLNIELKTFKTNEIIKMCELYDTNPDDIYTDKEYMNPEYSIVPAELQRKILDHITSKL